MKKHFLYCCILFLCSLLSTVLYSGESYKFRTFSPEGGFYYDGVKSISQDADGFIWVLMDNDLYRFDGYQYKSYYSHFRQLNPSYQWTFNNIAADSAGRLFVATNNGLYVNNNITDRFERLLDSKIGFVTIDSRNNIWISQNRELMIFNEKDKSITKPLFNGKPLTDIFSHNGDTDDFFVATYQGSVYRYDYKQKLFKLFFKLSDNRYIQDIHKSDNKLWILSRNQGIYKVDINSSSLEESYDIFNNHDQKNVLTKTLHIDKYGFLWIGTQQGLYVFNPVTKEYKLYQNSKSDTFSLPNNSVWIITEDMQRNIWLGTYSGGLCYVNLDEQNRFKTYTPKETSLNHNLVSAFAEDDKYLWIGTEGGGINRLDKETNTFSFLKQNTNGDGLSYNNVKSLCFDPKGHLWIATFRGGLDCYDTKNNSFRHFKRENGNENTLKSNDLRKILVEKDAGLWIAYQLNKLVISFYSFQDNTFTHYPFDEGDNNYFIFDICRGNDNDIWIITHKKLYRMNIDTRAIKEVPLNINFYLNAQSLYITKDNILWIGTIGSGLIRYDVDKQTCTVLDKILKFNVSSIYSVCSDDVDNLWLGTDNGLFRYTMKDDKLLRFDKKDGVQGQVYYPISTMKGKSGELYFGGTNGFTIVNSGEMRFNQYKPKVIISDFLIDNVSAKSSLSNTKNEIELDHNQINFGFKFSSDNYLLPEKNRFKFRLKGYDNDWVEVSALNRSVFYSKVPAGEYVFEVLTSNSDGVWSDVPTSIKIKRLPAPWLTWYAYVVYILLLVSVLYLIIRYYRQQKSLKLQLYLDKLDQDKKEEIHQSQLRFFTNISHDFRTPLSLILAALEKLRQEGLKEYYYRILNGNAQRLLNLVNELMDFRTIENGRMKLQLQWLDINSIVKEIASDFQDYAKQRHITFSVVCDSSLTNPLPVDKQIIEKVVMNLLNNAFKYTEKGGSISIETYMDKQKFIPKYTNNYTIDSESILGQSFSIAVRDNGIGISKDSIKNVFERFYKVKTVNFDSHLGTGIGLALVKSLVLLHKGIVGIYSERNQGTDMLVTFSANSKPYSEDDFLPTENILSKDNNIDTTNIEVTDQSSVNKESLLLRDKKRILLVEDNNDLRMLLAYTLSSEYDVVEAENGVVASALLDEMEINMIISDIMMPEKDGITLCQEVKNDINVSHIPFILLTAKTSIESKIEGADSGADLYFEKPIDFNLLLLTIQNIFKQQQKLKDYYSKNYFVDSSELSTNHQDNKFLQKFIEILDAHLDQPEMDVNYIASQLSMSRSKLYSKVKSMTDKSIVEFILGYRLRKAARLIVEEDLSMREVMERIGIESQSYFTRAFKKEFGDTPTAFATKHKKRTK